MRSNKQVRHILSKATQELTVLDTLPIANVTQCLQKDESAHGLIPQMFYNGLGARGRPCFGRGEDRAFIL
jgi:hypothetical protein